MARILVLTSDAPYFPGRMGVDFFNLRHLARRHEVGVVAPVYPQLPQAALDNLRRTVAATYFWPEPCAGQPHAVPLADRLRLRRPFRALPVWLRRVALRVLCGLHPGDSEGQLRLAVLANLAPYLLRALEERAWDVLVVVQSDTRPWLDYLPPHVPLLVYFHDVRSDYLARRARFERRPLAWERRAALAERGEREIAQRAEMSGFVSELDLRRAQARFGPLARAAVAPIPIDLDYFVPRGAPRKPGPPRVLLTGHLGHPPNVDAALFFLHEVWPRVRAASPAAEFRLVGALPADELRAACARAPGVELHADVPDIRPYFWDADVYVVPMRFGGGVRQKILEAWAMAVPVVLTPMAGEGSDVRHGENAWIAADPAGLAEHLVNVLERPESAAEMVSRARAQVRAHALERCCVRFEELVLAAIAVRRAARLRVLLDLAWLVPGAPEESAVRALLAGWQACGPDAPRGRVLAPAAWLRRLRLSGGGPLEGLARDSAAPLARRFGRRLAARLAASLGEHQPMSAALQQLGELHELQADLVHVFDPGAVTAGVPLPCVMSVPPEAARRQAREPVWARNAAVLAGTAQVVLCRDAAQSEWVRQAWGVAPERLRLWAPPESGGEGASGGVVGARPGHLEALRALFEIYRQAAGR